MLLTISLLLYFTIHCSQCFSFSIKPSAARSITDSKRFWSRLHFKNTATTNKKEIIPLTDVVVQSNATAAIKDNLKLDFSQLKPFFKIAVPFFKEDKPARDSLIAVLALTLLNNGISVAFSYISRDFYTALNNRDEHLFFEKIQLFFAVLVLAVPVAVFYRYTREKLSLYWREALTSKVLEKYYSNRTFYTLETLRDDEVDNPDQRIAEDIRAFTKTSLDFLITVVTSVIDLASFSSILFQIYPGLFAAIIAYAGIGSIVTTNLGQSLVSLNYDKLQKEANFRFSLFRTRENAEAIAFYDSDATREEKLTWTLFQKALQAQLQIVIQQRNLEFFTTGYRYIVQILPSLIVAPLYFAGKVELGAVSQSFGAFNHILSDFSLLINQFEQLSAFSAALTRLSTFIDRIDSFAAVNATSSTFSTTAVASEDSSSGGLVVYGQRVIGPMIRMTQLPAEELNKHHLHLDETTSSNSSSVLLEVRNLTVITPDGSRVILGGLPSPGTDTSTGSLGCHGVDIRVSQGDRVLIVGSSGSGKSSLVRAIAGLWQVGRGSINWADSPHVGNMPSTSQGIQAAPKYVFFLPQKPYNLIGTLKQQIMYPNIQTSHVSLSTQRLSANTQQGSILAIDPKLSSEVNENDEDFEEDALDNALPDEYFLQLLKKVRLDSLASKMGDGDERKGLRKVVDWSKVLSLGEQQRLAFARILFNKPDVVVLDEATSALDLSSEDAMYSLLSGDEPGLSRCTYISVGHRPTLLRYHSRRLVLRGPGFTPIERVISSETLLKSDRSSSLSGTELVDLTAY